MIYCVRVLLPEEETVVILGSAWLSAEGIRELTATALQQKYGEAKEFVMKSVVVDEEITPQDIKMGQVRLCALAEVAYSMPLAMRNAMLAHLEPSDAELVRFLCSLPVELCTVVSDMSWAWVGMENCLPPEGLRVWVLDTDNVKRVACRQGAHWLAYEDVGGRWYLPETPQTIEAVYWCLSFVTVEWKTK